MMAVTLALPRPDQAAQPAAHTDVALPVDVPVDGKVVDGRNRHHGHHGHHNQHGGILIYLKFRLHENIKLIYVNFS